MLIIEITEASGYIPQNAAEAKDPRWSAALSVDVNTHTMPDMLAKFYPTAPIKDRQKKVQESTVLEIERLPSRVFTGGKDELQVDAPPRSKGRLLPGGSGLTYTISELGGETVVRIWDPTVKYTGRGDQASAVHGKLVGQLDLDNITRHLRSQLFPESAYKVSTITVDEDYRNRSIAKSLYGIVLTVMKKTLIAGDSQTPGGRAMWLSLFKIPGVEVKGYISLRPGEIASKKSDKQYIINRNNKNIDVIMGELGGQYIGDSSSSHFFAFDVVPNRTGDELIAHVKTKMSKLYVKYYSDDFGAGLYATWTGK